MNFRGGDESADAAAAFDDAFAFERCEGVTRGHEAHVVEAGKFPFGRDNVPGLQLARFDDGCGSRPECGDTREFRCFVW